MLRIYSTNDESTYIDTSGTRNLYDGHNKRNNQSVVRTFYIRNTEVLEWLSNVYVSATSTTIALNGNEGFGVKFYYGSLEPTERVWASLGYNVPIFINNIGTSAQADTSFKKLWMRTEISPYIDVGMYDAQLKTTYIRHAV
jgi:hypothetical protein